MALWKPPPRAKVFEAFSAVADRRVRVLGAGEAAVVSSNGARTYTVEWTEDGKSITSNDNASYWQGYAGYPIVAVLLVTGKLHADPALVDALGGVDWHELNARHKRDYDAAVGAVLERLGERGVDTDAVERQVDDVAMQLAALELERSGRGRRPPAAR